MNQKGFVPLFIILGILVLLILIAGGIIFYTSKRDNSDLGKPGATSNKTTATEGYGWSYIGDFPVSAVNISTLKLPDGRYVAYYVGGQPGIFHYKKPGRAFSTDGITWQEDKGWTCPDLCFKDSSGPVLPHRKHLILKDGRFRTYIKSDQGGGIISYTSSDGLNWTKEDGVRLRFGSDMLGSGTPMLGQNFSAAYMADGKVRAYYEIPVSQFANSMAAGFGRVLGSAISTDDGKTFTKEGGVRVSSADYHQILPGGPNVANDPTVVAMDGGYRIFFGNPGLIMSAFSTDGLSFQWDGKERGLLPLWSTDPSPLILPDGRLLVMDGGQQAKGSKSCNVTQYPNGCPENYDLDHMIIWGKVPIKISTTNWDNQTGQSTISVTGNNGKSVTLRVLDGMGNCKMNEVAGEPACTFDQSTYSIMPASGNSPFQAVVKQVVPGIKEDTITIGVEVDGRVGITTINCINRTKDFTANACGQ